MTFATTLRPDPEGHAPYTCGMAGPSVEIPTRLLVFGMIRENGTIDAGELYNVANTCGMSDQQVRLCLRRLVVDGLFDQQGRGRRATFVATERGRDAIEPDIGFMHFAYQQDRGLAKWDGMWRMIAFAIPETRRAARDAFRGWLLGLGGAPMHGALYISPNRWEPLIESEARRLGLDDSITFIRSDHIQVGGESDPLRIARLLWPIDEIAERYRHFIDVARPRLRQLEGSGGGGPSAGAQLRLAFEIAAAFNRAIKPDPLLPPDLLPQPWAGTTARALLAECWAHLERTGDPDDEHPAVFRTYRSLLHEVATSGDRTMTT